MYKNVRRNDFTSKGDNEYKNNFCVAYLMQAGETVYLHPTDVYEGRIIVSKTDRSNDYYGAQLEFEGEEAGSSMIVES